MKPTDVRRAAFIPGSAPFHIARAEGAYLFTGGGRRILDAGGGAIVTSIGHGRAEVAEVAAEALRRLTYVVPTFMTDDRARLVDRLRSSWLPAELSQCTFVSGGSESVEAAIRLARRHHVLAGRPQRWKVIGTDLSYHGTTLGTLAAGGHEARRAGFGDLLLPFPKTPAPYSLRASLGLGPDSRTQAVDDLEQVILREGPDTVSAFICEPIGGAASGVGLPPADWWPGLIEVCHRHGVLVIADEVMCGFGRTGRRFGIEHFGVVPDILIGGKGLAAGYAPVGGLFTSEAILDPLVRAGEQPMFFTFDGHPASLAVANKVLEIMEREDLVARSASMGELLRARLEEEFNDHPNVAQIRGAGLFVGLELVRNRDTLEKFPAAAGVGAKVTAQGLDRGAWLYPGGTARARDTVMLGPPFTIESEDVDFLVDVLHESIDAVTRPSEAR